ncbi:MAG: dihydrofolate reductase [bacterium]
MSIAIIAAVAKNGVIGSGGELPWHIPEDLQRFRNLTFEKTVLMGRKTFESILARNGRPLPHRKNIVVTRQINYHVPPEVTVYQTIDEALRIHQQEDIFVIGGGEIYKQTLPQADTLYLTYIDSPFKGDTYFPPLPRTTWHVTERIERNGYQFLTYERKEA